MLELVTFLLLVAAAVLLDLDFLALLGLWLCLDLVLLLLFNARILAHALLSLLLLWQLFFLSSIGNSPATAGLDGMATGVPGCDVITGMPVFLLILLFGAEEA